MNSHYRDEDLPDDSPTDELPVLSEMDIVEDFERTSIFAALDDDTATRRFPAPEWAPIDQDTAAQRRLSSDALDGDGAAASDSPGDPGHDDDLLAATANRLAETSALEALMARVAELTERVSAADGHLADKDATIASLEERLEATRRAVARRDESEQQLRAELAQRDARITELEARAADAVAQSGEQLARLTAREESLAQRETVVAERIASLAEQNEAVARRADALAEHERRLALRDEELAARDTANALRESQLAEREEQAAAHAAKLAEQDHRHTHRASELTDLQNRLAQRDAESTARQADLARGEAALRQQDRAVAQRAAMLEQREAHLVECETALEELESELATREQALIVREMSASDASADGDRLSADEVYESGAAEVLRQRIQELLNQNGALQERLEAATAAAQADAPVGALPVAELAPDTSSGADAEADATQEDHDGRESRDLLGALRRSREEAAALADYIDGRRSHWASMEATLAEQRTRIEELDRELAQRAQRQQQAEVVAEGETRRVANLKAEIARLRALAADRSPARALGEAFRLSAATEHSESAGVKTPLAPQHSSSPSSAAPQSPEPPAQIAPLAEFVTETVPAPLLVAETAPMPESAPTPDFPPSAPPFNGPTPISAAGNDPESLPPATDSATRDRDEDSPDEMERRLAESEAQLDRTRAALQRLERILIERDRAMDLKNARIDALQTELQEKSAAAHVDRGGRRAHPRTSAPDAAKVPSLICLTGEAPRSTPLHEGVLTIGRSAECDIQVATHFVSREHARLTLETGGKVVIEDLGSKNGVFVNAVRVEREGLKHGDLVTVGETQFRFITG